MLRYGYLGELKLGGIDTLRYGYLGKLNLGGICVRDQLRCWGLGLACAILILVGFWG